MERLWKGLRYKNLVKYPLSNMGLIYFETNKQKEVSFYVQDLSSAKDNYFGGFNEPPKNVGEKVNVLYETRTQAELGLPNRNAMIWVFKGIDGLS